MDKTKKKNLKRYTTWGILAVIVLLLALMPMMASGDTDEGGNVASVLSGTVETGDLTTTLHGGGTLKAGNAEQIRIPSGVKITEFLVNNGDTVTSGTPLAAVDKVTVMSAILELRDTLDYLESEMEKSSDETVSSQIIAKAGGRVKAVYATDGDDVQQVMLEHGALAVISLDSAMAVTLTQCNAITTGDSVVVSFSDGTQTKGWVESTLNHETVITVEDSGYAIGETVTVATENGTILGSGELYVHNAWYATAFTGTISTVSAKVDKEVSSDATLFTLRDTDFTAQYEYLSSLHREYEDLMQELFQMYETGVITAPNDGVISGVDLNSAHLLSADGASTQMEYLVANEQSTTGKSWKVLLLSATETIVCDPNAEGGCPLEGNPNDHSKDCIKSCTKFAGCDANVHWDDCITRCISSDGSVDCPATRHYSTCIESCQHIKTESETCSASKYHYPDCINSCTIGTSTTGCSASVHYRACIKSCDKSKNCPGTMNHYAECVTNCDRSENCNAINHYEDCPLNGVTYTAYAAKVFSVGETIVAYADTATVYQVSATENGWALDQELRTDLMITQISVPSTTPCSSGDIILIMTGTNANGDVVIENKVVVYQKTQSDSSNTGGVPGDMSGMMGGMTGMGSISGFGGLSGGYGSATTSQQYELFDLDGDVIMTVTSQDSMTLSIEIDEQDIANVFPGQTAEVKINALKNETFEAVVTKVGVIGTNNGGSSKFTVELTLDQGESMLDGMSATATIPLHTVEDVPVIPVEALVEKGAQTFVYTALDKETGDPASPVVVEVGISDTEYAQILSGLDVGTTYYYTYYDTLDLPS